MRAFLSLSRKEFMENIRTYKLVIMVLALSVIGLMSPFLAKVLPDLISGTDLGNGVVLTLPEASSVDSWTQFFSNIAQLGMLVVIIVFCGLMASELSKGTLVPLLTKGTPRGAVILSKFFVSVLIWSVAYAISWAVCLVYTYYFWGIQEFHHPWMTFLAPWLFGVLLISLMILGGTFFSNIGGSLGLVAFTVVVLNLINLAPWTRKYNPVTLAEGTLDLMTGAKSVDDFIPAFTHCGVMIVVVMALSLYVFHRKQL
ncbi:MAG: hypothetical protein FWG15_00475 [Propionibacteriaceae bacterium]|nr:hypothetical protein [Propionibacteriaceae bacterium]